MGREVFLKFFDRAEQCDCSEGAVLFWAEEQSEKSYCDFCGVLEDAGYDFYTKHEENGNVFSTYTKDGEVINIYYTPCDKKIRMVTETGVKLPPRAEDNKYEKKVAPLVTQLKGNNLRVDCGMCYVIRLSDGRFVIIDTAFDEYEEPEKLMDVLREQNEVFEKPTIAACFITHVHNDHFRTFTQIMKKYADEVEFGDIIYNWPNREKVLSESDHTEFDEYVKKIYGDRIIRERSGQRFCYADATFDILFACDDLYPEVIKNTNDTSLVMRMEMNGRRILWTGDAQVEASACVCQRYGKESLESEFLQVAHHGFWGGSADLYRMIDAKVLLWPVPDFWYHEALNWSPNEALFESGNVEKIFISGRYQTVIDMTKPVPEVPAIPQYKAGDVIYSEDFSEKTRILDLDWVALTGGKTGGTGARLRLEDNKCFWDVDGERHTMLEVRKPYQLEDAKSYTLEFSGEVLKKAELFGLIFNNARPTVWSDEHIAILDIDEGTFACKLTLDESAKVATLEYQGKKTEIEYIPEERRGLYFVLKNGEIVLDEIKITKR